MKHNELQKKIMDFIGQFTTIKVNVVSTNGIRGVSDLIICLHGRFLAVEVKVGRDKLRPQQIKFLQGVNEMGGIGLVVHEKHYELFQKYILTKGMDIPPELLPPKEIKVKEFKV